jgi:hypothetical protein
MQNDDVFAEIRHNANNEHDAEQRSHQRNSQNF